MRPCVETHELAPFNSSNAEPLSPPTDLPSRETAKQTNKTDHSPFKLHKPNIWVIINKS
jgi:hypothetical protein